MTSYLWGVATPLLIAYVAFGIYIAAANWPYHPSEHWRHQYSSPYAKPPLPIRSWTVFLLLWIPTPVLWPLTVPLGKYFNYRYRNTHNKAARRAAEHTGDPA